MVLLLLRGLQADVRQSAGKVCACGQQVVIAGDQVQRRSVFAAVPILPKQFKLKQSSGRTCRVMTWDFDLRAWPSGIAISSTASLREFRSIPASAAHSLTDLLER